MATENPQPGSRGTAQWLQLALPILVIALTAGYLVSKAASAARSGSGPAALYHDLGAIPVSEDGRVKPLDTVARNALLQVSTKQSLIDEMMLESDGEDADRSAMRWLAEVLAGTENARLRAVIRIDDPEVLGLIGKTQDDGKYYSIATIAPHLQEIEDQARAASAKDEEDQTRFEKHLIELYGKVGLIFQLQSGQRPYAIPPDTAEQEWAPLTTASMGTRLTANFAAMDRAGWESWRALLLAYEQGDPKAIDIAIDRHRQVVGRGADEHLGKASFEQVFNEYRPFVLGIALYIFAGVLGLLTLLLRPVLSPGWYRALWRSGTGVLAVTLVLHTGALVVRMWLQGRPPVTNLYSSAVFIGWAVVLFALAMEWLSKLGIAALASSIVGVATLFIAHNLAMDGDTMGVMQAVLDSNFWLGTHVITVVLGYAAVFLAGFLALLFILLGMFTPLLDKKSARLLSGMVYGVTCFALLFSFVGTVLGGIWADQSWGRFWGWDPKENGAIMIVLITAIILHARWGHLVKDRGIMALAISGNIITAWSWFGTNLMGVGLHSYGFMDGAMVKLGIFASNQLLFMGVAMAIPTGYWLSFLRPVKRLGHETPKLALGLLPGDWRVFAVLSLGGVLLAGHSLFTVLVCFFRVEFGQGMMYTGLLMPAVVLVVGAVVYGGLALRSGYKLPFAGLRAVEGV